MTQEPPKLCLLRLQKISGQETLNSTDSSLSQPVGQADISKLLNLQGVKLSEENKQNLSKLIRLLSSVNILDRSGFLNRLRQALSDGSCLEESEKLFLGCLNVDGFDSDNHQGFSTVHHDPKMVMVMFDLGSLGPVNAFSNVIADLYIKYFAHIFQDTVKEIKECLSRTKNKVKIIKGKLDAELKKINNSDLSEQEKEEEIRKQKINFFKNDQHIKEIFERFGFDFDNIYSSNYLSESDLCDAFLELSNLESDNFLETCRYAGDEFCVALLSKKGVSEKTTNVLTRMIKGGMDARIQRDDVKIPTGESTNIRPSFKTEPSDIVHYSESVVKKYVEKKLSCGKFGFGQPTGRNCTTLENFLKNLGCQVHQLLLLGNGQNLSSESTILELSRIFSRKDLLTSMLNNYLAFVGKSVKDKRLNNVEDGIEKIKSVLGLTDTEKKDTSDEDSGNRENTPKKADNIFDEKTSEGKNLNKLSTLFDAILNGNLSEFDLDILFFAIMKDYQDNKAKQDKKILSSPPKFLKQELCEEAIKREFESNILVDEESQSDLSKSQPTLTNFLKNPVYNLIHNYDEFYRLVGSSNDLNILYDEFNRNLGLMQKKYPSLKEDIEQIQIELKNDFFEKIITSSTGFYSIFKGFLNKGFDYCKSCIMARFKDLAEKTLRLASENFNPIAGCQVEDRPTTAQMIEEYLGYLLETDEKTAYKSTGDWLNIIRSVSKQPETKKRKSSVCGMITVYVPIKPLNGDMREGDAVLQRSVNGILNSIFHLDIRDKDLNNTEINAWDYLDDRIKPYLKIGKMGANHYLFFDSSLFEGFDEDDYKVTKQGKALEYLKNLQDEDKNSEKTFEIDEYNKTIRLTKPATAWVSVNDSSINGNAFGDDQGSAKILAVGNSPDTGGVDRLNAYNDENLNSDSASRQDREPDYTKLADQVTDSFYFEELLKTPGLKEFFEYFGENFRGSFSDIINSLGKEKQDEFFVDFVLNQSVRNGTKNEYFSMARYNTTMQLDSLLGTLNLDSKKKEIFQSITAEIILAVEEFCSKKGDFKKNKESIIYALLLFLTKGRNGKYLSFLEQALAGADWGDTKKYMMILCTAMSEIADANYDTKNTIVDTPAKIKLTQEVATV